MAQDEVSWPDIAGPSGDRSYCSRSIAEKWAWDERETSTSANTFSASLSTAQMTLTTTQLAQQEEDAGILKLRGFHDPHSVEAALEDLDTKGWAVVKNVIPLERAQEYEERAYAWLESFGKGFKRDDKDTWKVENMPAFDRGGMFKRHGVHHERFVWDIRSEPDGINISLPYIDDQQTDRAAPWPHVDQNPRRRHKHCIQGIANIAPNGPLDGGLKVLSHSVQHFDAFFDAHPELEPEGGWPAGDFFMHREEDVGWLKDRGCEWVKVEAGPGDLILWDSRTVHYGAVAEGDRPRVATYLCYKPAQDGKPDKLEARKQAFAEWAGTTHDPLEFTVRGTNTLGPLTPDEKQLPHEIPVLDERARKLAGLIPY
ncbi:hypothetical protein B9479_006378 [Cryptococcus floricola]|uniref:Phytanoyl-CoA dioxygenase n=1 Tax=Cryptococcus floricola TaxID=2591691 RepID=A0A5D3AS33_9TREE|nr:hypothetical protein B9479_006378 [Cryptococcus floricola]